MRTRVTGWATQCVTARPKRRRRLFLVLALIANLTTHYLCAAVNVALYVVQRRLDDKRQQPQPSFSRRTLLPLGLILGHSTLVAVVHEYTQAVIYCVANIWKAAAGMTIVCTVLYVGLFVYRPRYCCCWWSWGKHKHPANDTDQELARTTHSDSTRHSHEDDEVASNSKDASHRDVIEPLETV